MGDDSVKFYLDLVDRTDPVIQKFLVRNQGLLIAGSAAQFTEEQKIQAGKVVQLTLQKEQLAQQRALNRELEMQRLIQLGLRSPGGGMATDTASLVRSYTSLAGLSERFKYMLSGQIGTMMLYGAVTYGAQAAVSALFRTQSEFMDQSARLSVVLDSAHGREREDLIELQHQARAWALGHGQAASDVIKADYDLAAAGLRVKQVHEAIIPVLLLAQGGFIEEALASEVVSIAMQAFSRQQLTALQIANNFQTIANDTNATVSSLAEGFKYSSSTMAAANLSFEEGIVVLGVLASVGQLGTTAGTNWNQALTQMIKKKNELRELGIVVETDAGQLRTFTEILKDLKKAFGEELSVGEQKLIKDLFDVRGARAIEVLLTHTEKYEELLGKVQTKQTAVFLSADEGSNKLSESWKVFLNQFKEMFLQAGAIGKATQDWLDALSSRIGKRMYSDISTGAAGIEYELKKLEEAHKTNDETTRKLLKQMAREWRSYEGDLRHILKEISGMELYNSEQRLEYLDRVIAKLRELKREQESAGKPRIEYPAVTIISPFEREQDVAKRQREIDLQKALSKMRLDTRKEELAALKAEGSYEYAERRRIAKMVYDLEVDTNAMKLKDFIDAGKTEAESRGDFEARIAEKRREIRAADIHAYNDYEKEKDKINYDFLRKNYGDIAAVRDLEYRINLERLAGHARFAKERERIDEELQSQLILNQAKTLAREFETPGAREAADELARLQHQLGMGKIEEARRKYESELFQTQVRTRALWAEDLISRMRGEEYFAQARVNIERAHADEVKRIVLEAEKDETGRIIDRKKLLLDLNEAYARYIGELNQNWRDSEEYRLQQTFQSIAWIRDGFSDLASGIGAIWGDATAEWVNAMAQMADTAGGVLNILDKMKEASSLGQFAGGFSIFGMIFGLLGTIFSDANEQASEVRNLSEEFRHREGRTVSPDFGRAQVWNVHNELNPSFHLMGAMTPAWQKQVAENIFDELVDMMEETGVIGGGGK